MLKYFLIFSAVCFVGLLVLGVEIMIARSGPRLAFHDPPRTPQTFGSGPALTYIILGDSTGAAQGASAYRRGYAEITARYLGQKHKVTYINLAVSGARTADVLRDQIPTAVKYKPNIVVLAVGANDVIHLTPSGSVHNSLEAIVNRLQQASPATKIILTGVPDMGSVPRIPQPLRALAGFRGTKLNQVFTGLAKQRQLIFSPIAKETGPKFRKDSSLFAADKFHANDRGYALWVPVLEKSLDQALADR